VVDTLFKGIKNATPANSTFQNPADPFFGGALSLIETSAHVFGQAARMGHVRAATVHSAVGT
jgi:hypothetical protein